MNRGCLAILKHYGRTYASVFRGAYGRFALGILVVLMVAGGALLVDSPGPSRRMFDGEAMFRISLSGFGVLFFLGSLIYTTILYHREQRREMDQFQAYPVTVGALALAKLLDAVMVLILPLMLWSGAFARAIASFSGLERRRFLVGSTILGLTICLAYLLGAMYMTVGGWWFSRSGRRGLRFPLFLTLWLLFSGLLAFGLPTIPGWSAFAFMLQEQLEEAAEWAVTGYLKIALFGSVAFLVLAVLFQIALGVIGAGYVNRMQELQTAVAAAAPVRAADGFTPRRRLPLLSPAVQAMWRKDLQLLSKHYTILLTFVVGGLLLAPRMLNDLAADLNHLKLLSLGLDWIPVVASVGTLPFQLFAPLLLGVEAEDLSNLAPYPATAGQTLVAKTLCVVCMHLPLMVLYLLAILWTGGALIHLIGFVFWLAWLLPLSLSMIVLGGVMGVRPGNLAASQQTIATVVGMHIEILFVAVFLLIYLAALALHWGLLLIGAVGCLVCFWGLLNLAPRLVPTLRALPRASGWRGRPRQRRALAVGLVALGLFFSVIYMDAGFRPVRYFGDPWPLLLWAMPIALAALTCLRRLPALARLLGIAAVLVAAPLGIVASYGGYFGQSSVPDPISVLLYPSYIWQRADAAAEALLKQRQEMSAELLPAELATDLGMAEDAPPRRFPEVKTEELPTVLEAMRDEYGASHDIWRHSKTHLWLKKHPAEERVKVLAPLYVTVAQAYPRTPYSRLLHGTMEWSQPNLIPPESLLGLATLTMAPFTFNTAELAVMLPVDELNETQKAELLVAFDDALNQPTLAKQLESSAKQSKSISNVLYNCPSLTLMLRLRTPPAFAKVQAILAANDIIQLPINVETDYSKLWATRPTEAELGCVHDPRLAASNELLAVLPRPPNATMTQLQGVLRVLEQRGVPGEAARYVESLDGNLHDLAVKPEPEPDEQTTAAMFPRTPIHTESILDEWRLGLQTLTVRDDPERLFELDLGEKQMRALVDRCIPETGQPELAKAIVELGTQRPELFADEDLNTFMHGLYNVPPEAYAAFTVAILRNGGVADKIIPDSAANNENEWGAICFDNIMQTICDPAWNPELSFRDSASAVRILQLTKDRFGREAVLRYLKHVRLPSAQMYRRILLGEQTETPVALYDQLATASRSTTGFRILALQHVLRRRNDDAAAQRLAAVGNLNAWGISRPKSQDHGNAPAARMFITPVPYVGALLLAAFVLSWLPGFRPATTNS